MSNTKEIEIDYNRKKEKVVIRRIGWAEKNTLADKHVQVRYIGNLPQVTTKFFEMRTAMLQKCIVTAPFDTGIESLNKEDPQMIEKIYSEIDEFNNLSKDLKKNLPESSGKQSTEDQETSGM